MSASYSPNDDSNDFTAYLEGGMTEGLTGRMTVFSRTQGATFTATDGGELGKETTRGISAILSYRPSERFKLKARIAYSEDDDGPASTTFVPYATGLGNVPIGTPITVNTTTGVRNTAFARTYIAGDLPEVNVSNNTTFYTVRVGRPDQINVGDAFRSIPYDTGTPSLDDYGLRTDMLVSSLALDFSISDSLTISGLFGYNDRATTQIRDADSYDSPAWVVKTALTLESWSSEMRVAYDNKGPWRLLGGVNYAEADQFGDLDGGFAVFDGIFGALQVGRGNSSLDNANITTFGVFASVEYDVFDWMTLAAEGRYQEDKSKNQIGWYDALGAVTELQFDEFLPRLSVSARPFEGANMYLSYAKGTLPGSTNNTFAALSPTEKLEAQALFPDIKEVLESEILDAYELGWKQSLINGSLWFSAVAFWQEWKGMKGSSTVAFTSPSTGISRFLSTTLTGSSTQKGVELEARWLPSDRLELQGSYGLTESKFDEYAASSLNSIVGLPAGTVYLANGKTLPRSPKQSAAVAATWSGEVNENWGYFVRGDVAYRGKTYTDELNITTIAAYSLLNFRIGLRQEDGVGLELFCNNCLDESGWSTGRRLIDLGTIPNFFARIGAVVDPITPIEVGVRFSYEF